MAEKTEEKAAELTVAGMGKALGEASHRVGQLVHWAKSQRDLTARPDWSAVHDTLEVAVFNLERAQVQLHHEATVLLAQAGREEGADDV